MVHFSIFYHFELFGRNIIFIFVLRKNDITMTNSTFVPSPISESRCEYICDNCDCEKSFVSEDYTIGYQLSGSCRIYSEDDVCIDVREHTLFLVEKGSFRLVAMTGSAGTFEQMLFSLDAKTLFGASSRDNSRSEKYFELAVLKGIVTSLTIEDVAECCCTSLSTFKRRFNERFARSPHRWFVSCRLDIAERIVGHTGVAVADLAEMCGFSNTSHFISAFRHRFGATPSRHAHRRYSQKRLALQHDVVVNHLSVVPLGNLKARVVEERP